MKQATALTIAGSDPSGGAGIQADLKTFHQFGVYGMSVISLLTVQNTQGVKEVLLIGPPKVKAQLDAIIEDMPIGAVKLGALGNEQIIQFVISSLKTISCPVIADPVFMSKNKAPLLLPSALKAYRDLVIPFVNLFTPNLEEASVLSGKKIETKEGMEKCAEYFLSLGAQAILMKGGHLEGDSCDDYFCSKDQSFWLHSEKVDTRHTHGVGCSLSSAITALLAQGKSIEDSVREAKEWLHQAISSNPGLGKGQGPVNHFTTR